MNVHLIANAPIAIPVASATVIPAFLLGTWLLFVSKKGSRWQRTLGFAYLT